MVVVVGVLFGWFFVWLVWGGVLFCFALFCFCAGLPYLQASICKVVFLSWRIQNTMLTVNSTGHQYHALAKVSFLESSATFLTATRGAV